MQEEQIKFFSTRDIYLASTLVALRFEMLAIDMQIEGIKSRPIGYFKYKETASLHDAISKYNQSLLAVEPRLLFSTLQALKGQVMNFEFNPSSPHNKNAL